MDIAVIQELQQTHVHVPIWVWNGAIRFDKILKIIKTKYMRSFPVNTVLIPHRLLHITQRPTIRQTIFTDKILLSYSAGSNLRERFRIANNQVCYQYYLLNRELQPVTDHNHIL